MSKKWYEVATTRDIDDEEVLQVEAGGGLMALYKLAGRFYASVDRCTCGNGCLSDGFVEDDSISCPACSANFEIRTGKPEEDVGLKPIMRFPVRTEDGLVYIGVDSDKLSQT